jgi:hypothetical protein
MTVLYNVWLDRVKFTYELENHRVARAWADMMKLLSVTSLRKDLDPWQGRVADLDKKISQFNFLIDAINTWIPNKIPGHFDLADPQTSLNQLHTHFPEQHYRENTLEQVDQLRTYNDLLHQIDSGIKSKLGPEEQISIIAVQEKPTCIPLEYSDYELFTTEFRFGDLLLHYPHVGRHPFEVATTNDIECPPEQIVCQNQMSASHSMRFYYKFLRATEFKEFYTSSGITWPYAADDPRLAVGYIRLGKLIEVDYQAPYHNRTLDLVKQATRITNWQIFDQNHKAEDPDDTN